MRASRVAGLLLVAAGLACLVAAIVQGSIRVGLFLIVPFVYGTGLLAAGGMLLIMVGGMLLLVSLVPRMSDGEALPPGEGRVERHSSSGGVVLLGPVPIVWGSDRRIQRWMLVLGAAMLGLWLLFALLMRG